jgi:hypothetical protein
MREDLSICLDTDIHYHHHFKIGDIIPIHIYPYKPYKNIYSNKVVFGTIEYNAIFTLDWNKTCSATLTLDDCITKGYLTDVTKNVDREWKLNQLGI